MTQQIIINPPCPACGAKCDGLLDHDPETGWYICPNLNCEYEFQMSAPVVGLLHNGMPEFMQKLYRALEAK